MTPIFTDTLFNNADPNRYRRENAPPCHATPYKRFRSMFAGGVGSLPPNDDYADRIHPGPPPTAYETVASDYPSLTSVPSSFSGVVSPNSDAVTERELIRLNVVVNERDAQRGFRMFDGVRMSVKDVSSEELFLERMKIAYSAYDVHVAGLVNKSPLDITKGLVRAVSACLTGYFSTHSMLRTNRPFIGKVLHLDCPDMFCSHSDFVRSFLFTNASAEDEALIALAEKVYTENDFDVCDTTNVTGNDGIRDGGGGPVSDTERMFDLGMRIAESSVLGGTQPSSFASTRYDDTETTADFVALSDGLPFQQRSRPHRDDTTAMLIVVTDFEALHNYVAYVLYLTPTRLSRRYSVNFDCLKRPTSDARRDCCRAREAGRRRRGDGAKAAISAVIEKKRRDKIDSMGERSAACDATLRRRAAETVERNNDVLRHVVLMLFDKCVTALIDRGFEHLNARRGYAVNSAKEIGSATIYTGIIDTVGEVSANLEGYSFDDVAKNIDDDVTTAKTAADGDKNQQGRLRFSLPLNTIVTEVAGVRGDTGSE